MLEDKKVLQYFQKMRDSLVEKEDFFILIKKSYLKYKNRVIIAFLLLLAVGVFLIK